MEEVFVECNAVSRNEVLRACRGKAFRLWNSSSVQAEYRESYNISFFYFPQKNYGGTSLGKN
jgi:hypothetical protein